MSIASDRKRMATMHEEMEELRQEMREISHKLDLLLDRQDLYGMMRLSEQSLASFLNEEPDIYTVADCKVVYR
jgi:aspartate/tyrosine/aromatic aminotransferase